MSDLADEANDVAAAVVERRVQAIRKEAAVQMPAASGKCLNCLEPVKSARYCDSDCRDDHERRIKRRS